MMPKHATIRAPHVEVGDAITFEGTLYMVRDGEPLDADLSAVRLRLSAGRTDPGFWRTFDGNDHVEIYRGAGIPDYALEA